MAIRSLLIDQQVPLMDPSPRSESARAQETTLDAVRRERDALARRLQIEEALKRVRVRTMAMHHSTELAEQPSPPPHRGFE